MIYIKSEKELDALGPVINESLSIRQNGGNLSFENVKKINGTVHFNTSKINHLDFGKVIFLGASYHVSAIKQISVIGSSNFGITIKDPTNQELDFLRILPLDMLDMRTCQSNWNWMDCKTLPELYECNTIFCLAGFARAYFGLKYRSLQLTSALEAGKKAIPNLSYMFYMNDELAKQEIKKLLK